MSGYARPGGGYVHEILDRLDYGPVLSRCGRWWWPDDIMTWDKTAPTWIMRCPKCRANP